MVVSAEEVKYFALPSTKRVKSVIPVVMISVIIKSESFLYLLNFNCGFIKSSPGWLECYL